MARDERLPDFGPVVETVVGEATLLDNGSTGSSGRCKADDPVSMEMGL
jgi:hypothetical protein